MNVTHSQIIFKYYRSMPFCNSYINNYRFVFLKNSFYYWYFLNIFFNFLNITNMSELYKYIDSDIFFFKFLPRLLFLCILKVFYICFFQSLNFWVLLGKHVNSYWLVFIFKKYKIKNKWFILCDSCNELYWNHLFYIPLIIM